MMSNIVEEKLYEAQSFLDKMREEEKKAFGGAERFDSYLSGFVNAARTVHYRLCYQHQATAWRKTWNAATQDNLIKFFSEQRRIEVR
jgi:hypothetical protein